jgi:Fe2+ or Zn2+ uptake regulation protein
MSKILFYQKNRERHSNKKADARVKIDLTKMGLKTTLPRLKILEIFHTNQCSHLSANEVF